MDGAQIASGPISVGKARTAARFRRESRLFCNAYEGGHPSVGTLDPTLVASPGGFPLVEAGKLIGAVGCSGGTGDQDAAVGKVGADVVNRPAVKVSGAARFDRRAAPASETKCRAVICRRRGAAANSLDDAAIRSLNRFRIKNRPQGVGLKLE